MTVKSIVDIDVNDSKFQNFVRQWDKYQKALEKTPNMWKTVNKEANAAANQFEKMAGALIAQATANSRNEEAARAQGRHLTRSDQLWTSMAKSTKTIAGNILDATRSLLSWSGILTGIGGLLGLGGLWGIDRMAAGAANQRRSSMGLGMSIGENQAFRVNFNRVVDPDAYLGWVNQMETDPTKAWSAYALGAAPTGNTENDAIRILKALRSKAQATPTNQLGLLQQQYGLSGVSTEDLRRLKTLSGGEFNQLLAGNQRDIGALGISDPIAKKWQDFTNQMERAGDKIFKTFVLGLAPLEKPLEHLSEAAVKFLDTLMKSDLIKEGITKLADWLNNFSGEVGGEEFLSKVRAFTSDIGDLADAIHTVAHPIDSIVKPGWNAFSEFFAPSKEGLKGNSANFQRYLGRLDTHWGLTPGLIESVKGAENSGDDAVNKKSGAMGAFQFRPDTWAQYGGGGSPFDRVDAANAAGRYLSYLQKKYGGDVGKTLAAYNWGEGNLDKDIASNGANWQKGLPRETRQYLMNAQPVLAGFNTTRIEIFNNTGGSAQVSVSQLAH
jgi:hypothetical protein